MDEDQKKLTKWSQEISRNGRATRYTQEFCKLTAKVAHLHGLIEANRASGVSKTSILKWMKKDQTTYTSHMQFTKNMPNIAKNETEPAEDKIKFQEVFLPTPPTDRIELKMPNGLSLAFMGDQKLKLALVDILVAGGGL